MEVKLTDVIEAIEFEDELLTHYYNKETGIIIYVEDSSTSNYKAEDIEKLENFEEWEQELIKTLYDFKCNPDNYIQLPNNDEVNEGKIMIEYSKSINDSDLNKILLENLTEDKLIKKLKEHLRTIRKIDEWYSYRENAEYYLAKNWCNANNIKYVE